MTKPIFYSPDATEALLYTRQLLTEKGYCFTDTADTSVTHLLLGIPSFRDDGMLKSGQDIRDILSQLKADITIVGGNLLHSSTNTYKTLDLLQDPLYVAQNACITAHCALRLILWHLPTTLLECPVLVIGWGRIGKCLGQLFHNLGAQVTIAARKETDRAMASALGYQVTDMTGMQNHICRYRVILNTAPEVILTQDMLAGCRADCLKIDLASQKGMDAEDVIWARGLPGKDAPESSGTLIANTIIRLIQ